MKKTIMKTFMFMFALFILAACGGQPKEEGNKASSSDSDDVPEMIEVSISTDPSSDQLKPKESFTIQAKVTQGDENVNDADEVEFEFWKKGQEEHKKVEGEFTEKGVYEIEKTVNEPGTYYVISHVTARGMHNMPQKELQIGEMYHGSSNEEGMDEGESYEEGSSEESDHGEGGIVAHVMLDDKLPVNEEVTLVGHLQKDNEPLTEAEIQFEVWKNGDEKHEYVDAKEGKQGEYSVAYTFKEQGEYHVNLHYKKGDMHSHKEKMVAVE
ncbi:FixH family protein [Pontibacillus yanchengensis]|uniref:FixH family protein n=1 Tax=Pontibacillus yanchengensis TaxID=462910 RepID=UPI00136AFBD8|nr:FixH family protein [Pontibacillus yanchengensis]